MPIKPPIIIRADDGIHTFKNVIEAESYMEPIDVENGVYSAAYDSTGRILKISSKYIEKEKRFLWFRTVGEVESLVLEEIDQSDPYRLRELLIDYISRVMKLPEGSLQDKDLETLINMVPST